MRDCVFCKILRGELPAFKLFESDDFTVILDRFPHIPGQTIIIDKKHEAAYFGDMSDRLLGDFLILGKKVAKAICQGLGTERTALAIEGLDVDHAHIKIYPVYSSGEYAKSMGSPKHELSDSELGEIAQKIRKEVDF